MLDKVRIFRLLYRIHGRGFFPLILLSVGSVAFLFTLEKGPLHKNHDIRMRLAASAISTKNIQTETATAILSERNTTYIAPKNIKVVNSISQVKHEDDNKPQSYLKILEYMQAESARETILATAERCKSKCDFECFNRSPLNVPDKIVTIQVPLAQMYEVFVHKYYRFF